MAQKWASFLFSNIGQRTESVFDEKYRWGSALADPHLYDYIRPSNNKIYNKLVIPI
jgi:hypothetical protein